MKLKMASNSLFAVLLRSPWWISFAVVLAVALLSRALLPQQYVVFGVMGGFPFLIIGVIAAVKQFQAPSPALVARTLESLATMSWRDFSSALEKTYQKDGFTVTPVTGPAADLLVVKAGRSTLVSAKRWKAANHGVEPLRHLAAAKEAHDASHCVYITLGDVNDKTRQFALRNHIQLLHGTELAHWLRDLARP